MEQVTRNGKLNTYWLDGVINALTNQIKASGSYANATALANKGFLLENNDTNSPDYGAMYLGPGWLMIANTKLGDGSWNWRTFGTGKGFTADLINAGLIQAQYIQIGSGTNFSVGYDPSTKETPTGAQTKADTAQTNAISTAATDATTKMNQAKADAAAAQTSANTAQTTADNAQTSANSANTLLSDIASDSKLTAGEKQAIKKEWDTIVAEKTTIEAQATTYGITTEKTNYGTSYTTLDTYITPLLSDLTTTSDIVGTTFRDNFKDYYDKKTILLKVIAEKAKTLADTAQQRAVDAEANAINTASVDATTKAATAETNAKNASVPKAVKFDASVTIGDGNGITVQDGSNNLRVRLGQYEAGKYGLLIKNKAGTATVLDEDGMMQTDSIQLADNVNATHSLKMKIYVDDGVISVNKVKLNFSLEAFRAYSTGAASGGSTITSNANSATINGNGTTTSGSNLISSGMAVMGGSVSGWIVDSVATGTVGVGGAHTHTTGSAGSHDHGGSAGSHNHGNTANLNTAPSISSDGSHSHTVSSDAGHTHALTMNAHSHNIYNHSHYIDHTHDIPNHTHAIVYGIYEGTSATGVKVKVDGIERLNNGGVGYSTDQNSLDLTAWVTTSGWHTIEMTSTQLGRINASLYIKSFVGV